MVVNTTYQFDYYPFGMIMPGRTFTSESYRYGFNGMEKDGEQWTGNDGSHLDFGARIYDSRLGRWLAMDPLESKYPFLTPYNGMGNNPIWFIDPDGMRIKFATSVRDNGLVKEYKTILKILKQGSPTFKKMLMSVRFNKEVYKLDVTTEDNGDAYLDKVIYISCDNFDNKNVIVFAHEFGHLWRDMKNLDIKTEDIPFEEDTPEHFIFRSKMRLFEEGEALHIENIIRTELNIEHRESYNGLSDFTSKDIVEKFGKRRVEIKNRVIIDIYKEVSYDYKKDHHYKDLKTRKHSSDEIDINKRGVD
jgi:RHS repeat-associated protein